LLFAITLKNLDIFTDVNASVWALTETAIVVTVFFSLKYCTGAGYYCLAMHCILTIGLTTLCLTHLF